MENEPEKALWMILNGLSEVGPGTFRRLKEHFNGKINDIFLASYEELSAIGGVSRKAVKHIIHWRDHFNIEEEQRQLTAANAKFFTQKDKNYPSLLREIYDAPIGLYMRGVLDLSRNHCIAIVGTRHATRYGLKIAWEFARELASLNFTIVSGLAIGIDNAAHEGALAAEGRTVAVVGSGVDVIYPRENKALYAKIAEHGSILSEFPMGKQVAKITFPIRNRIMAGMCSHTIVIESGSHGGSMITANIAKEYGRGIMAVPGYIGQPESQGCHELIRRGATLVSCMDHILEALDYSRQQFFNWNEHEKISPPQENALTDPIERCIISFLKERDAASLDEISEVLAMPIHDLLSRIQLLELRQLLRCDRDGNYIYCCH
jgi:DNA processing protein